MAVASAPGSPGATVCAAPEAAHPHIHARFVHLIGEQQAMGFNDFAVANAVNLDEQTFIGFEGHRFGLGLGIELQGSLQIALGNGGIQRITLEPERSDRSSGCWFDDGLRRGFRRWNRCGFR